MATFWWVEFWPATTYPTGPWDGDPDVAAWLGTSRRVCEAYSARLRELGFAGRHSMLRLRPEPSDDDLAAGGRVVATVNVDRFESFEFGHVGVPRGVARLGADQRGQLVLATVHGLVTELARARGWDAAALAEVHHRILAGGCRFERRSDWKSAPGRRRRARALFDLQDDGFGRATLEVEQPDGTVTTVGPALAFTTHAGFDRSAKSLRWHGKDAVQLVPYRGIFGDDRGLLRWQADGPPVVDPVPPPVPGSGDLVLDDVPSRVFVAPSGDSLPGRLPEIRVIGGGPMNYVSPVYEAELHDALDALRSEAWQRWWAASGETLLAIRYDFGVLTAGCRVRRTARGVGGWIDRPAGDTRVAPDPAALAREDVRALMHAVARRFELGELPGG